MWPATVGEQLERKGEIVQERDDSQVKMSELLRCSC